MLIATMTAKDGRKVLVIGLHADNVARLVNDMPIYKRLDGKPDVETDGFHVPGLEDWDLTILGPEDTARFVAHFGEQAA